jgi:outer membrane protein TolC
MPLPVDEELFAMVENRPDLLSTRKAYESQEAAVQAAIASQIPTTNVSVTRAMDTSAVGTLGAGVSIDVQLFDRNQGQIANARALRNKILQQYDEQVFAARAEVDSALADIRSIESQIATIQQAIPVFEQLVAAYDKAVKENNANVLVYYLAFNDLIQQRVALWRLRKQLMDAIITLETAVGSPLDPL